MELETYWLYCGQSIYSVRMPPGTREDDVRARAKAQHDRIPLCFPEPPVEAVAHPCCMRMDDQAVAVDARPGSERIHQVRLASGRSVPASYVFDATNHLRVVPRSQVHGPHARSRGRCRWALGCQGLLQTGLRQSVWLGK